MSRAPAKPHYVGYNHYAQNTGPVRFKGPLDIRVSAHDTTDDIMLIAGSDEGGVDIELTFDEAQRLAYAIIAAINDERQRRRDEEPSPRSSVD